MPKLTLIGLYFWICLAQKVVSGDDLSLKVGGDLLLTPDKSTVTDPIISILWKHGKNKVAECDKDFGGLDIYAAFKNRTTLDQTTGELRISGLKKNDSGVYSVELNSKLLDKTYKLSVIKPVPKPTITSSCNTNKTSCTLTCEGDITDAEPVTYSWKLGERAWEVVDKQFRVSKSDTGKSDNGYKYTCKLKNAVSEEVSEPVGEVFGSESSNTGAVVGVVVTIVVLVAVIIGFVVWKKKTGYPQDIWIDFLRKYCGGMFGDAGNIRDDVAADAVYHTVGDVQVTNHGPSGVLSGVAMDTVYSTVGEKSSRDYSMNQNNNNQPTNTGMAVNNTNSVKSVTKPEEGGSDESKMDGSAGPEGKDETKTDGTAAPGGEDKTKTDCSAGPGSDDETKTDGTAAPGGEDKTKTDCSAGPGSDDETKTDGTAAPGSDSNAAEKEEANGEGSVLLNEDTVKYNNGEAPAEENSAL
ncbi:uncharacterized protein LOC115196280 isoform X1 [Salmo trutta]|uniref:uncharacterized protein LOC115196280 isoform X1 n=1 Tax=Salmo trutta TaxID=8032 RepID=UPI00113135C5|nr:uncharacterized protein LOC115196280 isoform X1 [Salmo trutta]